MHFALAASLTSRCVMEAAMTSLSIWTLSLTNRSMGQFHQLQQYHPCLLVLMPNMSQLVRLPFTQKIHVVEQQNMSIKTYSYESKTSAEISKSTVVPKQACHMYATQQQEAHGPYHSPEHFAS